MDALGTKIDMARAGLYHSSTFHPHLIHISSILMGRVARRWVSVMAFPHEFFIIHISIAGLAHHNSRELGCFFGGCQFYDVTKVMVIHPKIYPNFVCHKNLFKK
jgi:hypothetical protein